MMQTNLQTHSHPKIPVGRRGALPIHSAHPSSREKISRRHNFDPMECWAAPFRSSIRHAISNKLSH